MSSSSPSSLLPLLFFVHVFKGELGSLRDEVAFLKGEAGEGEKLEESDIAKLRSAIDSYVVDTDAYATLQMGKMTLTKLKDAFAIFKNLVIMARNDSKDTETSSSSASSSASSLGNTSDAEVCDSLSLSSCVPLSHSLSLFHSFTLSLFIICTRCWS